MSPKTVQLRLGLGACFVAMFLVVIGIPNWVSSPSNVRNIVLAPTFWPYVLSALTGMVGLGLVLVSRRASSSMPLEDEHSHDGRAWPRLGGLALVMIVTMFALPRLGMVWTTMLVFIVTALLFRTRHPLTALVCAIVVPLALYAFFAHVAGVAIPQGNFVRLP